LFTVQTRNGTVASRIEIDSGAIVITIIVEKKRRQLEMQTLPEAGGSGQSRMPRTSNNFKQSYGLSTSRLSNNSNSSRWRRAAEAQQHPKE